MKRRLAILPLMCRQVCDIAKKMNELRARVDATARTTTADQEKGNCSLVTAYVPIRTRTQLEAFDEKLKTDAEFIQQFVRLPFFGMENSLTVHSRHFDNCVTDRLVNEGREFIQRIVVESAGAANVESPLQRIDHDVWKLDRKEEGLEPR